MAIYKEIITKAVLGKGKKHFQNKYDIMIDSDASTVLGCWVINHQFRGHKSGDKICIDGSYDVNVWYSYDNDSKTAVINERIEYNELVAIKIKDAADLSGDTDIIIRTLKQPTCSKMEINDGYLIFDIEKELGVEIVGETKLKILVEMTEEPWDEVIDEVSEKEIEEIDKINEDYI